MTNNKPESAWNLFSKERKRQVNQWFWKAIKTNDNNFYFDIMKIATKDFQKGVVYMKDNYAYIERLLETDSDTSDWVSYIIFYNTIDFMMNILLQMGFSAIYEEEEKLKEREKESRAIEFKYQIESQDKIKELTRGEYVFINQKEYFRVRDLKTGRFIKQQ